jgi:hypothetical protein
MPVATKITREAKTLTEAQAAGFYGTVKSYPNELHELANEQDRMDTFAVNTEMPSGVTGGSTATLKGAKVNTDDAPTPSGTVTGPGAAQPSTAEDKENK